MHGHTGTQKKNTVTQKSRKLSMLLGLYLMISILGFSIGVLIWTYHSSVQTISLQLGNSFEQGHTLAESVMERQLEFIGQVLREIRGSESFSSAVFQRDQAGTEEMLYEILDSHTERQLDILFVSISEGPILADAGSPFFDTESVLPEIMEHRSDLLSSGRILHFGKASAALTVMLSASRVIQKETGRILGTLFGGVVLNKNLSLLETIRRKTKSEVVVFIENGNIIGSTDLLESQTTQTLMKAMHKHEEGDIHSKNGLLASHKKLSLSGRPTSLDIVTGITDQILTDMQHSYLKKGSVLLVFSLAFLFLTAFVIRKFTFPSLENLLNYSADVSAGDLQARHIAGGITEFNRLGEAIEQMVKTIRDEIEERRQAEAQVVIFRQFAETSGQGFGMADLGGHLTYVNHALCRMFGEKRPEDALGKHISIYYTEEDALKLGNEVLPAVSDKANRHRKCL